MQPSLVIAVSPYHLTTREAPALAALLLGDRVVTLLPAPPSGRTRDDVRRAVSKSPRYLRMMESWRWTIPLWHAGVLGAALGEDDPGLELRSYYGRIAEAGEYAALRPLTRHAAEATPDQFLDLLAADILKGGPDPGLNIPVNTAIDEFAARHTITVARSAATSVAQRAEAHLGRRVFSIAIPVLSHASSRVVLRLRDELRAELADLRAAMADAARAAGAGEPADTDALARAARAYTASFNALRARLEGRDDDEGVRIAAGFVGVTGLVVPSDVAMRSGLAAARSMSARPSPSALQARHVGVKTALPAAEPIVALVIKPLAFEPDVGA